VHTAEALKGGVVSSERSCSVGPGGYPSARDELLDAMCVVHVVVCLVARSHVDTTSTITDCTQVKVRFDLSLSAYHILVFDVGKSCSCLLSRGTQVVLILLLVP
jgi:hypothetical protein